MTEWGRITHGVPRGLSGQQGRVDYWTIYMQRQCELLLLRLGIVCLAINYLGISGCAGWHVGQRSLYRADIQTVHVPIVQSDSYRRQLGERLTEAIVKQIELRTPYKVVDAAAADSILSVRLVSESKRLLSQSRNSDARDIETDFFAQMSWSDRRGDLIVSGGQIPFSPLMRNIGQQANFVPEAGQSLVTAQQEALQKIAEQIVDQMEVDVLQGAGCKSFMDPTYNEPMP